MKPILLTFLFIVATTPVAIAQGTGATAMPNPPVYGPWADQERDDKSMENGDVQRRPQGEQQVPQCDHCYPDKGYEHSQN